MTLDALKKQAARLASYMGAKHRIKLKHSSALEAIAAAHGARNWQTLAAEARGTPALARVADKHPHPLPLTRYSDGQPHIQVSPDEWTRHAIAVGPADDVSAWVRDQAATALSGEYSMVLVEFASEAATTYSDDVVVLDMSQEQLRVSGRVAREFGINILKGLSEARVGELTTIGALGVPTELYARFGNAAPDNFDSAELGLKELLELAVPIVIILPERGAQMLGELLLSLLDFAVRGTSAAWVLALPTVEPFYGSALSRIAEQGRAMGCFLRAGVNSTGLRVKDQHSVMRLNMNAHHHVDLRSVEKRMPDMLKHLASSPASCVSGGRYMF